MSPIHLVDGNNHILWDLFHLVLLFLWMSPIHLLHRDLLIPYYLFFLVLLLLWMSPIDLQHGNVLPHYNPSPPVLLKMTTDCFLCLYIKDLPPGMSKLCRARAEP